MTTSPQHVIREEAACLLTPSVLAAGVVTATAGVVTATAGVVAGGRIIGAD